MNYSERSADLQDAFLLSRFISNFRKLCGYYVELIYNLRKSARMCLLNDYQNHFGGII